MNIRKIIFFILIGISFLSAGWKYAEAKIDSITIFCGSANKPPMSEIVGLFERQENIKIHMIFGGSGTLLSQIELSKKGEIYLPASSDYIITGERKGLIIKDSDQKVAYLVPAIITPHGNPANIRGLEDLSRSGVKVGIGNPETVCLGLFSIELLEKNDMSQQVMKNVITFSENASKLANLTAMNQVDAVIGWRVFHFWNPDRMDFVPFAPERIPRIAYIPISIPVYTKDINISNAFIQFVLSPRGREIYAKHGYLSSMEEAKKFAPHAALGGEYKLPSEYFDLIKNLWGKK